MVIDETDEMKIKDLFDINPLLTGRTEIDTQNKLNTGLVWSCPGSNFMTENPDTDAVTHQIDFLQIDGEGITVFAPVFLPDGATVTAIKVWGNFSNHDWTLSRMDFSAGSEALGSAAVGTEDTSISNAVINNNTYCYALTIPAMTGGQLVYGARVIYTI